MTRSCDADYLRRRAVCVRIAALNATDVPARIAHMRSAPAYDVRARAADAAERPVEHQNRISRHT